MMIEFQMTAEMMRDLVNYRMQIFRPCMKNPLTFGGMQFYVDQVHLKESSIALAKETQTYSLNSLLEGNVIGVPPTDAQKVERRPLRLSQKVVLDLVEPSKLIAGGSQGTDSIIPREVLMVFEISVDVYSDGSPAFCVRLHDIPELAESLKPEEVAQILSSLRQEVDRCEPFDLGAMAQAMKVTLPPVVNAGITITSGANKIVVIRLDLETKGANAKDSWNKFYTGAITPRLFGAQWSAFMPEGLIISMTEKRILKSIENQSKFDLQSGPSAAWAPEGDKPGLNVSMSGEIIDACPPGVDLDVDVQVRATLTVPKENVLRTTIKLDWSGDTFEESLCLAVATIVWPVVGGLLLSDDKVDVWEFIGGLLLPFPLVLIAGIVYLNSDEPMGEFDAEGWVKDSDSERHQDLPIPDKVGFIEGLKLTSVFGVPEGVVLAGNIKLVVPLLPQLKIGQLEKFEWKVEDACNAPTAICEPAGIGIIADPMGVEPRVPLVICSIKVINDPKGFYQVKGWNENIAKKEFVNSSTTLKIKFAVQGVPTYDCQVLIVTNAGIRVVTVPAPSAGPKITTPSLAEPEKFHDWMKWKGANCWLTHNIWVEMGLFNPEWHIDPGPFDYAQQWWIGLTGLNAGDVISLNESKLGELSTARVGPQGTAELSAMIEQPRDSALMISRNGARMDIGAYKRRVRALRPPTEAPRSVLTIKQVLLVRTGMISLRGEFRHMSLGYDQGRPTLLLVTSNGLNVYELGSGIFPRRLHLHYQPGLAGAIQHRGELFTWGSEGLQRVSSGVNVESSTTRCDKATPTFDFAFKGQFAYALEPDGLRIYDWNLCPVEKLITRRPSPHLAVAHDRLVIASRDSLEFFDISRPTSPVRVGTMELPGIEDVEPVQGATARRKVYIHTAGGGGVLDLTNAERAVPVAEYRVRPWYSQSVRRGTFMARHDPERRVINLYRIADAGSGLGPRPRVTDIWPNRGR